MLKSHSQVRVLVFNLCAAPDATLPTTKGITLVCTVTEVCMYVCMYVCAFLI